MKVTEIISEAGDKSSWQSVKDYGSELGTELKDMPGALVDLGKDVAKSTGDLAKKAIDPAEREKFYSQMGRGWEATKKDPMKAAKMGAEIADTGVRSAANVATLGYADKAAAAMSALGNKDKGDFSSRYEKEKEKEYTKSAELRDKYPAAAQTGDVAGLLINPVFQKGAQAARYVGGKVVPGAAQKVLSPVKGQAVKNVAKGTVSTPAKVATDIAGGLAATKAAEKGIEKYDPTDPYYGEKDYRVFEERLKYLINYR